MEILTEEPIVINDRKIDVRIALLENQFNYIEKTLYIIKDKIDKVDYKVDEVESKLYSNIKWFLSLSITTLISIIALSFEIHQMWSK